MSVNTECTFGYDKVDHAKENEGHLMVTLNVPEKDIDRTPLCAVLVLDGSGSMGGLMEDRKCKMDGLKDVARSLVQQLSSQDEIAIVTYSDTSEIVLARIGCSNKEAALTAIRNLNPTTCTNIGGGLIDGLKCINNDFTGVKRIFLLSDGLNNSGMQNSQVLELVKNRREYGKNITLSTFGLGNDCDQEFMADLAKAGEGNYYFIKDASDMRETFARELGGALACEAQNIEVTIKPNNGNEVVGVLNDFTVEDKDGTAVIKAEDIYVGEKRHILVKLKVSKVDHPKPRKVSIAHVDINYHDVSTNKSVKMDHNITVEFVKASEADKEEKLEVREQVGLLQMATAQAEAVVAANAGDFVRAKAVYTKACAEVDELVACGSVLCASVQDDFSDQKHMWEAGNYNQGFGNTARVVSAGMHKMRGSGGLSNKLYETRSAKSMVDKFQQPQTTDPVTPDVKLPAVEPDAPAPAEPVKPKGFTKRRSGE